VNTAGAGRALWVVASLAAAASLRPQQVAAPCEAPMESAAVAGWTAEVACAHGGRAAELRGPARLLFGERLDANTAEARALETLPGIGPALAGRLVEARAVGAYCGPRDLERVRGIGPVLRERLGPWLSFAAVECPPGRSVEGL
jgi:DNA uptake protein ComE-like DNA-binding protein